MSRARALALAAAVLVAAACRPRPARTNDSGSEATPVSPTKSATEAAATAGGVTEKTMKSTSTTWASPARNSRVAAPRRRSEALVRVTALGAAPEAVLVNEAGDHVALDLGARYELRDAAGEVAAEGAKPKQQPLVLWAKTLLVGENELDFTGKGWSAHWPTARAIEVVNNDSDKAWAIAATATDATFIVQKTPRGFPRHGQLPDGRVVEVHDQTPATLQVDVGRFLGDSPTSFSSRRSAHLQGQGAGAIADDGRVVVVMSDQHLFLYDGAHVTTDGTLHQLVATALDFVPTDVSVVEGGFAVLSGGGGAVAVHLFDAAGKEAWRATVPFAVDAPPIDAGGGRVFLTGLGFASVENGRTLWAHPSTTRVLATTLADGSALVATGAELRATTRDGAIVQSLRIPEGDPIVAPPAVAADGTAWVATAKALYVAR